MDPALLDLPFARPADEPWKRGWMDAPDRERVVAVAPWAHFVVKDAGPRGWVTVEAVEMWEPSNVGDEHGELSLIGCMQRVAIGELDLLWRDSVLELPV